MNCLSNVSAAVIGGAPRLESPGWCVISGPGSVGGWEGQAAEWAPQAGPEASPGPASPQRAPEPLSAPFCGWALGGERNICVTVIAQVNSL